MNSTNTNPSANLPKPLPRCPAPGFLYIPPFRVQGISIAGEETAVAVPELDLCFDIGRCPRLALTANYIALSHGHMDHAAGIAYYFSQRHFQGLPPGTLVCHPALEQPIHNLMRAWIDIEAQRTPYNLCPLAPEQQIEIKNNIFLRAFAVRHSVPSLGFVVIEKRSKLRPELVGLPQEKLLELKNRGQEITRIVEVPLVAYTGDTLWGEHLLRPDLLAARILLVECTFTDPDHRERALVGQHLHLEDVIQLLDRCQAEAVVLLHMSRRTHIAEARKQVEARIPPQHRHRVFLLMDQRSYRLGTRRTRPAPGSEPKT